jgi:hypothetical protein
MSRASPSAPWPATTQRLRLSDQDNDQDHDQDHDQDPAGHAAQAQPPAGDSAAGANDAAAAAAAANGAVASDAGGDARREGDRTGDRTGDEVAEEFAPFEKRRPPRVQRQLRVASSFGGDAVPLWAKNALGLLIAFLVASQASKRAAGLRNQPGYAAQVEAQVLAHMASVTHRQVASEGAGQGATQGGGASEGLTD